MLNSLSFCLSVKLLISPWLPWWLRKLSICLQCGRPGFDPWVRKIPWRRKWQYTPLLLPGKSHGLRSLVGYSPWGGRVRHDWATPLSLSYLNEILAGYSNLGCKFFSFITVNMSCHSLLTWRVSIERSAVILMGFPLCVICCFSLATFNICSLLVWLVCVLGCFALGLFCLGFSGFLELGWLFPSPF